MKGWNALPSYLAQESEGGFSVGQRRKGKRKTFGTFVPYHQGDWTDERFTPVDGGDNQIAFHNPYKNRRPGELACPCCMTFREQVSLCL